MQTRFSEQYDKDDLTHWVVGMVWTIVLIDVAVLVGVWTGVFGVHNLR